MARLGLASSAELYGWTPEAIRLSIHVAEARGWRITVDPTFMERCSIVMGIPPEGGEPRPVPNFAGCWEFGGPLLDEMLAGIDDYVEVWIGGVGSGSNSVHIRLPFKKEDRVCYAEGAILPEAIARVWLKWHERGGT